MERFTKKQDDGKYYISQLSIDNSYKNGFNSFYGKPIDKLADFEEFMEENGFESLEDLQTHINKINKYELGIRKQFVKEINEEDFFDMKEENQALKDRWQKLKEWAENNLNYNEKIMKETKVDSISYAISNIRYDTIKSVLYAMLKLD